MFEVINRSECSRSSLTKVVNTDAIVMSMLPDGIDGVVSEDCNSTNTRLYGPLFTDSNYIVIFMRAQVE